MMTAPHQDSELDRLVALEAELEEMLKRVRADARSLVQRERARADAARVRDGELLEAAIAAAQLAQRDDRVQRAAAITAEAGFARARYDAVSETAVAELGDWLVGLLLSGRTPS